MTLLAVTVWLCLSKRPSRYTAAPTAFNWFRNGKTVLDRINGVVAGLLMLLALQLIVQAIRVLRASRVPVARVVD